MGWSLHFLYAYAGLIRGRTGDCEVRGSGRLGASLVLLETKKFSVLQRMILRQAGEGNVLYTIMKPNTSQIDAYSHAQRHGVKVVRP